MSGEVDKSWMFESDIFGKVYRDGVKFFIQYAYINGFWKTSCACPCAKCKNRHLRSIGLVEEHLYENGIDQTYVTWVLHGEHQPVHIAMRNPPENVATEQVREDALPDLSALIDAAFEVDSDVRMDDDDDETRADNEEPLELEPDMQKRHDKYKNLAKQKLYPTCEGGVSTLSAIIELLNVKKQFGISGNCVDSLLKMIKGWLPKENTLPSKYSEIKSMVRDLGMKCKSIHACPNHCILYYKEHENATRCPVCDASRYKVKEGKFGPKLTKEPCLVLRHFPVGERLKRFYIIPWISDKMYWHHQAEVSKEFMRHPIDSPQWDSVKKKFPEFTAEGRNVWFGISTDGFNPNGVQSLNISYR